MIEHLSEGNVSRKKGKHTQLENNDFFSALHKKIEKQKENIDKSGLVVYFDIFKFEDIRKFLRGKFNLDSTLEEIGYSQKFRFALYLDKDLKLKDDRTFYTVSGYIREKKEIPREGEFKEFENDFKQKLSLEFEELYKSIDKINKEDTESIKKFNMIFERLLDRESLSFQDVHIEFLKDIKNDTNLHSFFITDLEKAKSIKTDNLISYLTGKEGERINLDSKKESENFEAKNFEDILSPINYPLGRFPSNTDYSLAFMQQVAVNLASGLDNKKIRGVNGPPGTGKTTLLKDIFAELVVQQANEIVGMSQKKMKGSTSNYHFNEENIGELPDKVTEKNIVVASTNNAALQNIVNELPLLTGIDEQLRDVIVKADYFYDIINSSKEKNKNNKEVKDSRDSKKEDLYWGLFSFEGGNRFNLDKLSHKLKDVHKYLENDYKNQPNIYNEFKEKYKVVSQIRSDIENFAKTSKNYSQNIVQYENIKSNYELEKQKKLVELEQVKQNFEARESEIVASHAKLHTKINQIQNEFTINEGYLSANRSALENLTANKPKESFFSSLFGKKDSANFQKELENLRTHRDFLLGQYNSLNKEKQKVNGEVIELGKELSNLIDNYNHQKNIFDAWNMKNEGELKKLKDAIDSHEEQKNTLNINILDLDKEYDELQLDNPWFDKKYRYAQSELFILALQVRKQFLYENLENIKYAIDIWEDQQKYLDNKEKLAGIAFSWINLVIPVISSTFPSFSNMFRNLGPNSLGHLFIDEAGQALPQASVGAIYRSKNVTAVGDPSQIKPVLTLESNTLVMLAKYYNITEKYISVTASTQTLVDATSSYGFYKGRSMSEDSWVGVPLWVHRRCQYPMFTISNEISYGGRMVQGNKKDGRAVWYDIKGKAINKYVPQQGEFLKSKIKELLENNSELKDQIYVISPFKNVVNELAIELKDLGFEKEVNIGTIHTFQGKEASIVFMVLGADEQSRGAARWAVSEANMMNVAVTRAKEEFYIIGDRELYTGLGSDIVDKTYDIIKKHQEENLEIYKEYLDISSEEDITTNTSDEKIKGIETLEEAKVETITPEVNEEVANNIVAEENTIVEIPKKDVENIQENSTLVNNKVESKSLINKINKRPTAKPKVTIEDTVPNVYKCSILIKNGIKTSKNNTKFLMAYSEVDGKNISVSIFENNPNYKKALEIVNKKDYKNNKILLQLEKSSSSNKYWNVTEKIIEN